MKPRIENLVSRLSPPERDRLMQVQLAQARGKVRNGDLLRQSIDRVLRMKASREEHKGPDAMDDALINTLTEVSAVLDALGVAHAVTGSVASSLHGEPFASLDVDLLVIATARQAAAIARQLSPRFYAPEDMLADAARDRGFTNVVDNRTGLKVDLSFVTNSGFFRAVMARRTKTKIGSDGPEFDFVTPEDIILMKLDWRRDSQSQKQWDNALGVAQVRGARMDWKYLFEQAGVLGVTDDLIRLRDEAGI